ncbi:MAG: cation transporter [Wenzhouxiangellaceae bacterium]
MQSKNMLIVRSLIAAVLSLALAACSNQSDTDAPADAAVRVESLEIKPVELVEVTFSVPDMVCLMCPIAVRRQLEAVDGVHDAIATLSDKSAVVRFDPARTDLDQLIVAIRRSGFNARLKASSHDGRGRDNRRGL